jgi:hypothetical protein
MGHFALTVQAGILLGRALRNVRDSTNLSQNSLLDLQNDEAVVLRQAILLWHMLPRKSHAFEGREFVASPKYVIGE